jgi:hypothetical protein
MGGILPYYAHKKTTKAAEVPVVLPTVFSTAFAAIGTIGGQGDGRRESFLVFPDLAGCTLPIADADALIVVLRNPPIVVASQLRHMQGVKTQMFRHIGGQLLLKTLHNNVTV